jgi:hypothetical protein
MPCPTLALVKRPEEPPAVEATTLEVVKALSSVVRTDTTGASNPVPAVAPVYQRKFVAIS